MAESKILDIIVPAYESHNTIGRTLGSIMNQSYSDRVRVTIVNDGGTPYNTIVTSFSRYIDVRTIDMPSNRGPGVARQFGVDHTDCKYIMFCDADDLIGGDCFAIEQMIKTIEYTECDILINDFIDQRYIPETEELQNVRVSGDLVWMHGKIYRRKTLLDNNIKFHPTLRTNEDFYFNQTCYSRLSKIEVSGILGYTWLYRPKSITHSDNYDILGYEGWYEALSTHLRECNELYSQHKYPIRITEDYINYHTAHGITLGFLEYNEFITKYEKNLCERFLSFLDDYYDHIFRDRNTIYDLSGYLEGSYANNRNVDGRGFIHPPIMGLSQFIQMLEDRWQAHHMA